MATDYEKRISDLVAENNSLDEEVESLRSKLHRVLQTGDVESPQFPKGAGKDVGHFIYCCLNPQFYRYRTIQICRKGH